jgi:hypothetical protein
MPRGHGSSSRTGGSRAAPYPWLRRSANKRGWSSWERPSHSSAHKQHAYCPLLAARSWTPKSVRFSLACSPLIAEATIRCSLGHPGYTGARATCAPEPYNLSPPRSRPKAKHSTWLFSSFVVSRQGHAPLVQKVTFGISPKIGHCKINNLQHSNK